MKKTFVGIMFLLLISCGPAQDTERRSSGTGGNSNTGGSSGGQISGNQCTRSEDCPYWYCECANLFAPVNSRSCINGQCQSASVACTSSCSSFGTTWTGRTYGSSGTGGGGGTTTSNTGGGTGGSSSGDGSPGSVCGSRLDCNTQVCGCIDGAVLNVRDCVNSRCNSRAAACDNACYDTGHEGWDGR